MLETVERCDRSLGIDRDEFIEVLTRVGDEATRSPLARGAAVGALWTMGAGDPDRARRALNAFADPSKLGDFLAGLFGLAREAAQRRPELLLGVDRLVAGYSDEHFLEALPSLRLAFTYFTPREKHHMAASLLEALGVATVAPLAGLEYGPEAAARALAFEARLFRTAEKFGVRGGAR